MQIEHQQVNTLNNDMLFYLPNMKILKSLVNAYQQNLEQK